MKRELAGWALSGLLLAGCGGGGAARAPEILYGEDICDRCRMVISEERHAAAFRLAGGEYRFDDPGCLLAYQKSATGSGIAWVHDEESSWRRVEEAWFVEDPDGGTPMASGILAFSSGEAAMTAGQRYDTEPWRWADSPGE